MGPVHMPGFQSIVDLLHFGTEKLNKGMPELDLRRQHELQLLVLGVYPMVLLCGNDAMDEGYERTISKT